MTIRRRAALSLGALAVAGCAGGPALTESPGPAVDTPVETAESTPSRRPTPEPPPTVMPTPSPTPTTALPSRSDIVERFAGEVPTQWGLAVDGVVLRHEKPQVALTFDACGGRNGSGIDEELLAVLEATATPATLFVNARWAEANPSRLAELIANPLFEMANHGTSHLPLSVTGQEAYGIPGTASVGEVYDEVVGVQEMLTELIGEAPRFFRSGTAHYDDVAVRIVDALGLTTVNFDVNSDAGATFTPAEVHSQSMRAREGSICIGHFNRPGSGTAEGIRRAIPELLGTGLTFARLGDLL